MSFTKDELQAFNTILEQRLTAHRRELERTFDLRLGALKREFEQRLARVQREMTRQTIERQQQVQSALEQRLRTQQMRLTHTLARNLEQIQERHHQQLEEMIKRTLAAQLLGIEQLIDGPMPATEEELAGELPAMYVDEEHSAVKAIEVQTEISWEDLAEVINKALDDRLGVLDGTIQSLLRETEHSFSSQLQRLREELLHARFQHQVASQEQQASQLQHSSGSTQTWQEVLASIEQLERIVETMQLSMSANHAFLSNRLFHHQHQPLERAHAGNQLVDPFTAFSPGEKKGQERFATEKSSEQKT